MSLPFISIHFLSCPFIPFQFLSCPLHFLVWNPLEITQGIGTSSKSSWSAKTVLRLTDESKIKNRFNGWFRMPSLSKQIETGPKRFYVSVRFVCTALLRLLSKCSLCRRCFLGYARFRTEIGLISGDFMKNTEMSAATKSNRKMQPESERRLHQFQDSLLQSAWVSCQWQFRCHECIELEKEMKWHSIS